MKSFLLKDSHPTIKWGLLEDGVFFEGKVPEGYALAVCPSDNYIILDVDVKNNKNGFIHILETKGIIDELGATFHYPTKSGGEHYWLNYTGDQVLLNKATKFGLDLRVAKGNYAMGYVKYPHSVDIRECIHLIKETSKELNTWLEELFSSKLIEV